MVRELEKSCQPLIDSMDAPDKLKDYLNEKILRDIDFCHSFEIPIWLWAFILVSKNGDWEVGGWGITSGGGPFGSGLNQMQAIELIQFNSMFNGVEAFGPQVRDLLLPAWEEFQKVCEEDKSV